MKEQHTLEQDTTRQEEAVVMMPTYDEMMQRLQDADLFGTWEPLDNFHRNLMWQLRESPTSGIGLVTAWRLSAEDVFSRPQYRGRTAETFRRVAEVEFNRVVDAITPSAEVAEQAKAFQRQLREEEVADLDHRS